MLKDSVLTVSQSAGLDGLQKQLFRPGPKISAAFGATPSLRFCRWRCGADFPEKICGGGLCSRRVWRAETAVRSFPPDSHAPPGPRTLPGARLSAGPVG